MTTVGVIAGLVASTYWKGVVGRSFPATQPVVGEGAGSAAWDPRKAREEVVDLQEHFTTAADAGNTKGIGEDVQRLVERYPRYAPARTLLAQVYLFDGRLPEAYEQLKLSIDLDRQQPEVHLLAGTTARQLGFHDEAARFYSTASQLTPENVSYRLHLAQAYMERQDYDRARMQILEALSRDSSSAEAYALQSDLEAKQNHIEQALVNIQKAIENTPLTARPLQVQYIRRKAQLMRRNNKPDEALLVLDALSGRDRDFAVLGEMATCWGMLGKPAKGAKIFEDALAENPTSETLAIAAAEWWGRAQDKKGVQRMIDRLREMNPRLPVIADLEQKVKGM